MRIYTSKAYQDLRGGSDFTYLRIHEGWLCLAIVVDLFSRKVVGWAVAATMDTL